MLIKTFSISLIVLTLSSLPLNAQLKKKEKDTQRFFIGSTLALLGNLDTKYSPEFVQFNFGYRLTNKDAISLELKTWKYEWSLGVPITSFQNPDEKFPGYIREHGFAFAYQRFWGKGLYSAIHVMNAWQTFVDETDNKIDSGFQIFNTYRLGYHIKLFKGSFFIEPSLAITHRPYHTEMPPSFKQLDDQRPKYFLGELGLHFGYNF